MMPLATEKITARQLERRACVYVRQSTPTQVRQNRTSQENQYALVQKARALGWPLERIEVIDADLGQSGQDSTRVGFQALVSAVSLGHVGIILAYEASRLARNNADWYRLLDLAAVMGAVLADADGVYDPQNYNDRLLLGLRGMMSEAELHLLQLRLQAGRQRQIERGCYRQHLPTGLERLADGRVVLDQDQQIQRTMALVFSRFATLGSCHKVLRSFRDDTILLPRRQTAGRYAGELWWKRASAAAIYEILRNPAYAGAFVSGRTAVRPNQQPGRHTRTGRRPLADWAVIHQDVYPAYISWEQFMANQERLADNASAFARRARAAPRSGSALLAGIVVCGRCGHQMRVSYKSRPRYFCTALTDAYHAPMCLSLEGAPIDQAVVEAFFAALAPAELDLLEAVLAAQQADHTQLLQHHADQVQRAEYEVRLAQRQYQRVDPDNRLVAAELEHRWELALRALAEAKEAEQRFAQTVTTPTLDPALRAQLADLGQQLPALWTSGVLSLAHQKALLRSLIRRVILSRPNPDSVAVKVVWVSGAFSLLTVAATVHRSVDLHDYAALVARIRELSEQGYQDAEIARCLTAEGFRSPRHTTLVRATVERIRRRGGQVSLTERFRTEPKIGDAWTVAGLATELGVSRDWLRKRIAQGTVPATLHPHTGRHLIVDDPAVIARLRTERAAHSGARRAFC
jgi:DNA invertase Pin-like site-specific DNA recombinase